MNEERFWLGEPEPEIKRLTAEDIYDDIVGRDDIARELDVDRARVQSWLRYRERNGCPQPIKRVSGTDLYSIAAWKSWYARWIQQWSPDSPIRTNAKPYSPSLPSSFWSYVGRTPNK